MTYYEALLFGHLLMAMVWVGGGIMLQFMYARAKSRGPEAVAGFASDVEWIGMRVTTPATVLLLLLGILLVVEVDGYDFGQFWILAALGAFAASFITGAGFLGPETGRIARLSDERGPTDPEVQSRIGRLVVISRIELLVIVLIVLDMVLKPGL
jgi:uncharacterized membrane protein